MSVVEYRDQAVRRYVITGGRARPSRDIFRPGTLLVATRSQLPPPAGAAREQRALLHMCRQLLPLGEAASRLELPLSLVRVIASDLVDAGHLAARTGMLPDATLSVLPDAALRVLPDALASPPPEAAVSATSDGPAPARAPARAATAPGAAPGALPARRAASAPPRQASARPDGRPSRELLQEVLDGLRRLS